MFRDQSILLIIRPSRVFVSYFPIFLAGFVNDLSTGQPLSNRDLMVALYSVDYDTFGSFAARHDRLRSCCNNAWLL